MSLFPGGVALTDLVVYDEETPDGCRGGSPHLHTASSEGYVVVGGSGAVQTVSAAGYAEDALRPGDVLWFTPGTVHRLVNHGDLRLLVVMSNAGLPEAGDAVLTFPLAVVADAEAYAAAAAAALPEGPDRADAVRRRRDLAVEGFLTLRDGGPDALSEFHALAARLVQPRVAGWRAVWQSTVAAETERTRDQLAALAEGRSAAMSTASVTRAVPTSAERAFGMCGHLHTWRWPSQ